MASTQEFLQAVLNMQQNAQANLPVEPNNGNPRGANNMTSAAPPVPNQVNGARHYPWLAPSSSMDFIRDLLARPIQTGGNLPAQPAPVQGPIMSTPTPATQQVVLPTMNTGGIMPPSRIPTQEPPSVVLPRMQGRVFDAKYGM